MDSNILWPDEHAPSAVKDWVTGFFLTADTNTTESAKEFANFFHEDCTMTGMGGPLHGKQAIYTSRLGAWDSVVSRKHILYKVYSIKKDFSDIVVLGKLKSTLKNGNSFEMHFAAQIIFSTPFGAELKATSYYVWADKSVAKEAAKTNS